MQNFRLIFLIGLSTFFCSHTSLFAQRKLNPNFLQKIKDALPSEAPAKPKKPRKLLIYTRASGFVHGSIPYGGEALRLLGEKSYREISEITGKKVGTVGWLVSVGLKALCVELGPLLGGESGLGLGLAQGELS